MLNSIDTLTSCLTSWSPIFPSWPCSNFCPPTFRPEVLGTDRKTLTWWFNKLFQNKFFKLSNFQCIHLSPALPTNKILKTLFKAISRQPVQNIPALFKVLPIEALLLVPHVPLHVLVVRLLAGAERRLGRMVAGVDDDLHIVIVNLAYEHLCKAAKELFSEMSLKKHQLTTWTPYLLSSGLRPSERPRRASLEAVYTDRVGRGQSVQLLIWQIAKERFQTWDWPVKYGL